MIRGFSQLSIVTYVLAFYLLTALPSWARDYLAAATDFDGDRISDIVTYEASGNIFTIRGSKTRKFIQRQVGSSGAMALPGDYDGDGRAELVTYNRLTGEWIFNYLSGGTSTIKFGGAGYQPVPARYSGNDCTDMAVYNRKHSLWKIRNCVTGSVTTVTFGSGGIPVPADYDCDKKADIAVYDRFSAKWRVRLSSGNGDKTFSFGKIGDVPLPADFNADVCAEPAVYRYSNNTFYVGKPRYFSGTVPILFKRQWGMIGDRPALIAFDKDYKTDFSVYRAFDNVFYNKKSDNTTFQVKYGDKVIQTSAESYDDDSFYDQFDTYEELIVAVMATQICERQVGEVRANFISRCQQLLWSTFNTYGDEFEGYDYGYSSISQSLIAEVLATIYPVDNIGTSNEWTAVAPQVSQNRIPTPVTVGRVAYQDVAGDFDRDGRTNLTLVSSPYGYSLTWKVIHDAVARTTYDFGAADSDIVTGDYDGDGKSDSVFVRESLRTQGALEWVARDAYGIQSASVWGKVGDRPVPGDFDCDGVYDQVVARKSGKSLYWHFRFSGGGTFTGKKFGSSTGTPYAADMNGDGCDEMVIAQKSGNEIAWYVSKIDNTATVKPVYWGLNTDMPLKPYDLNGDGRADYTVVRTVGNNRQFFVRFGYRSAKLAKGFFFGTIADLPTVGYFTNNSIADVAIYRYKEGALYTLSMDGVVNGVSGPKGAGLPLASDGTRIVNTTIGDSFDLFGCSVTYDFYDGAKAGALWKPVSESTGNALIILPSSYGSVRSADLLGASAEYITSARFRGYFGNGRPILDTSVRSSAMAAHNPITVRFKYNGLNVCYVVEDARVRAD